MSRKEQFKDLFTFTKSERNGIIVLIIILIIVIAINLLSDYFLVRENTEFADFKQEIEQFEKGLVSFNKKTKQSSSEGKFPNCDFFHFDPNTADSKDFKQLGLNEKQIRTIHNYLSKGAKFIYKSDFSKIYGISEEQFLKLEPFIDLPVKRNKLKKEISESLLLKNNRPILFNFDPNTISDQDWIKLGFSEKQVAVIRKYINKGGKFYNNQDLKKIYVISDKKYTELEPYIKINQEDISKYSSEKILNTTQKEIDINSITKKELALLGGKWEELASRLVNYRKILGGFYKKEQLMEVYGLTNKFFYKVSSLIIIDQSNIKKLNINFAEYSELKIHPYLTNTDARNIVNYRSSNGPFKKTHDLIENDVISKDTFKKIELYLTL